MRVVAIVIAALSTLALADAALAAAPVLLTVGHQNRHPTATFQTAGADDATIYFSTSPDRATDGSFLSENIETLDSLTDDEIQSGLWNYEDQLDPGRYHVLLRASDYDCAGSCVEGFSAMHTLDIPRPKQRYRRAVTVYRFLSSIDLRLTITPVGDHQPYRVCWTRRKKARKCVRGTVEGYSWNAGATDTIEVRKRGMRRRTTFSWYVDGRKVATKRARIPRS